MQSIKQSLLALVSMMLLHTTPAWAEAPLANVTVERSGDVWTADYTLHRQAPVWVFADSILPREGATSFRARSWKVLSPGVRLERRGWYDVLVADSAAVPERVTIRFTPFVEDIEASYDAALAFSDGSVALYDQKFKVFPAPSVGFVEQLPIDIAAVTEAKAPTRVRMRDFDGPVLLGAERVAEATLEDAGTYVLFGKAEPVESEALATIMDPALPQWLASYVTNAIPAVLDYYAQRLGPAPGRKPLLLVSWAGPTPGVTSMGGSVLESMLVMTFEGGGLTTEKPNVQSGALWFAAHEGAHFWLGQAVSYERPQESWITEGGADLLAYRAVGAIDRAFDERAALQKALDACVVSSRKGGIASANERSDHKAYYNCGAVFGLVAETVSGGDFAGFVRRLIEANQDDRKVSRNEWLAALDAHAPGRALGAAISQLLDTPASDVGPWAQLLKLADVPYERTADGSIELR